MAALAWGADRPGQRADGYRLALSMAELTFTRNLRREGLDARAAVREAAALRFRPTLLSNLTAMLALIPAALGLGEGPQLLQPLGVMLFGGLTAGALLTLTLLPVLYVATERWRRLDPVERAAGADRSIRSSQQER